MLYIQCIRTSLIVPTPEPHIYSKHFNITKQKHGNMKHCKKKTYTIYKNNVWQSANTFTTEVLRFITFLWHHANTTTTDNIYNIKQMEKLGKQNNTDNT